ncbi:TnsA-like heteromeric transposase endonuclease subunit [Streptomyces sp. NPDC058646]|uniref:TnsA-like heteromeric transposase endonuclease subunit n=1 Tax=Streptomyces sp. NPDC058646 TaxID=3346574 RepID=UPI00365B3D63
MDVEVCVRLAEDEASEGLAWESVPLGMLYAAEPWRTFRWYMGQKHYSGSYWSSTQADHVIYESRLELARLLYADFDRDVTAIVAQPFLLRAEVDGVLRRHIPDYLMATTAGPLVVDVKPRHRAAKPEHAYRTRGRGRRITGVVAARRCGKRDDRAGDNVHRSRAGSCRKAGRADQQRRSRCCCRHETVLHRALDHRCLLAFCDERGSSPAGGTRLASTMTDTPE